MRSTLEKLSSMSVCKRLVQNVAFSVIVIFIFGCGGASGSDPGEEDPSFCDRKPWLCTE